MVTEKVGVQFRRWYYTIYMYRVGRVVLQCHQFFFRETWLQKRFLAFAF